MNEKDDQAHLGSVRIQGTPGAWPARAEHQALPSVDIPLCCWDVALSLGPSGSEVWRSSQVIPLPYNVRDSPLAATSGRAACGSLLATHMGERGQR